MAKETVKNIAASVRARLLNIAKKSGRDFDAVLLQYMQERFLYRLSLSPYRNHLILKGALLFLAYDMSLLRPTRDIVGRRLNLTLIGVEVDPSTVCKLLILC